MAMPSREAIDALISITSASEAVALHKFEIDVDQSPQLNGHAFEIDEWSGISSQEHDEALMLEAAMFGGIPDERRFQFGYRLVTCLDDEYLASLQSDREKELKAQQEAELCSFEEANARGGCSSVGAT
ncbi:hypothetical protein ZIOFF_055146 [Zingiber officinale]|uniref:Uncharacterized protein n=1 Tax=Zingiber officinale TaxID=94328 RepID=A0A8J5FB37_ZINOF|nr:hypothetical protein ZIOFF_055146 [Zingiber officinale]